MVKGYYKRWVKEHPRLQVYVSREEYDKISELAENTGLSVSELVRRAIKNLRKLEKEVYKKALENGLNITIWMISRGEEDSTISEALEKHGLEYLRCPVCNKPFAGFIVKKNDRLADRIKRLIKEEGWAHEGCLKKRRAA